MKKGISGQVVLVTGAARGIGAETARRLAQQGARLSLVGLEPQRLEALARELGEGHVWFECDVTDQAALDRAFAGTAAALGGVDVVIANSGIANNGTVAVNPPDALARTIEVNLIGVVRTASAAIPHLEKRKGHLLFISSASAIAAMPGLAAYAASKIGVEHFANALRLELLHRDVTVGVALPCWIDTDLVRDTRDDLPTFRTLLGELPFPFRGTTSLATCADALARAATDRRRKVFIPWTLAPFAFFRSMFWTRLGEIPMRRLAKRRIPPLEREVAALGRCFGKTSVEAKSSGTIDGR
jgi:NAD(P)-dependent dehydrogenase (short-subunit alcohol dehydrogenase family)